MNDRERIQKAYGLLCGAGANGYIISEREIQKIPIPIKLLGEVINILDDKCYELDTTTQNDS